MAPQAAGARDVEECSLPSIAKQTVLAHAGDVNIREAVVVVVTNGHTHAVHFNVESGLLRHVGECSVSIVAIEAKGGSVAVMSRPVGAVDEQDVLPAVGIVVEKCATRTEGFGKQLSTVGAAVVAKLESGGLRDIDQLKTRHWTLTCASRCVRSNADADANPATPARNDRRFTERSPARCGLHRRQVRRSCEGRARPSCWRDARPPCLR